MTCSPGLTLQWRHRTSSSGQRDNDNGKRDNHHCNNTVLSYVWPGSAPSFSGSQATKVQIFSSKPDEPRACVRCLPCCSIHICRICTILQENDLTSSAWGARYAHGWHMCACAIPAIVSVKEMAGACVPSISKISSSVICDCSIYEGLATLQPETRLWPLYTQVNVAGSLHHPCLRHWTVPPYSGNPQELWNQAVLLP